MRTKVIINDISPFFFSENFTITPAFYVFCTLSEDYYTYISVFFLLDSIDYISDNGSWPSSMGRPEKKENL